MAEDRIFLIWVLVAMMAPSVWSCLAAFGRLQRSRSRNRIFYGASAGLAISGIAAAVALMVRVVSAVETLPFGTLDLIVAAAVLNSLAVLLWLLIRALCGAGTGQPGYPDVAARRAPVPPEPPAPIKEPVFASRRGKSRADETAPV